MPEIVEKGKGALTHKIGPLPLWGWVVAGAAAVFVVKKVGGSRGGGAPGGTGISIPTLSPGGASTSGSDFVAASPNQNVHGGMDTAPAGTAPWWASEGPQGQAGGKPASWYFPSIPSVPLTDQPSSNGSAGAAPAGTTANDAIARIMPVALPTEPPPNVAPGNVFQKMGKWFDVGPYREKIDQNENAPVVMSPTVAAGGNQYTPELIAEIRKNDPGWTGPYSAPQ